MERAIELRTTERAFGKHRATILHLRQIEVEIRDACVVLTGDVARIPFFSRDRTVCRRSRHAVLALSQSTYKVGAVSGKRLGAGQMDVG